jgi:hypothetical protein
MYFNLMKQKYSSNQVVCLREAIQELQKTNNYQLRMVQLARRTTNLLAN